MKNTHFATLTLACSMLGCSTMAAGTKTFSMTGTWEMTAAYETLADGTLTTNYGEHPRGLMLVDEQNRYSVQIFRSDRPRFSAGVKGKGTADEFRAGAMGSSTHFGRVSVDATKRTLTFKIEASSYPNWEGTEQLREYTYVDDVLTYAVPASASGNGTIAYSVWRRAR